MKKDSGYLKGCLSQKQQVGKEGAKGQNKQFVNLDLLPELQEQVPSLALLRLPVGNSLKHSRRYNGNGRLCFILSQKKVELCRERRAK